MVALSSLIPTKGKAQIFADVSYHVGAEAVPVLTVDVSKTAVYFEHHTLLWKHPTVHISLRNQNGGGKRLLGGDQVYIAEASGQGMIAFSRDGPGRVVSLHMPLGREIEVREHQFLAATKAINYSSSYVKGASNLLHGSQGYFIDKFHSGRGDGVLWIYAYGHIFEKVLESGESIDIEPGAWLYKETTVRMETMADRHSVGGFRPQMNMIVNRFTGPGRVGVQSMYMHNPSEA